MVGKQGQEWISLPLASHKEDPSAIVLNQIRANMMNKIFKRKKMEGVVVGVIWSVEHPMVVQEG